MDCFLFFNCRKSVSRAIIGTDPFSALSEGLASEILSRTSPRDVCRSSAISKGFKSFADSNNVWDRFLPSDHREILSKSVYSVDFSSKKKLYFHLVNSYILLDGGKLSFSLDKASGKKCFMLGARELAIECERKPVKWTWRCLPQSRFSEVAGLEAVPWFDITGKIEARLLSPKPTYVAYLVFNILRPQNSRDNYVVPAKASVRFDGERGDGDGDGDGDEITNIVSLTIRPFRSDGQFAQQRVDNWMETELGEFFNGQGDTGEIEMRLMGDVRLMGDFEGHYWSYSMLPHWTYDIFIKGIELRLKSISE
ncbi:hypothetical protein Vadar_020234 [Vaccinium darrowii]|uniref:Uncharacterized protein n=1 Tax=Vaccinium darrowii TaxID=229202 RepID=A0ACB7ZLQ0_9ERIC|nr:hypothetical protein Vadar_020234 [Vaccinium darrowii]